MLKFSKKIIKSFLFIFELFIFILISFFLFIYIFFRTELFVKLANSYANKNLNEEIFNLSFKEISLSLPFSINFKNVFFYKFNSNKSVDYSISIPSINFKFLFSNLRFSLFASDIFFKKNGDSKGGKKIEVVKDGLNYNKVIKVILNLAPFIRKVDISSAELIFNNNNKIICGVNALIGEPSKNYVNLFIKKNETSAEISFVNLKVDNDSFFSMASFSLFKEKNEKIINSTGNLFFNNSEIKCDCNLSLFNSKVRNIIGKVKVNVKELFRFFNKENLKNSENIIFGKFEYDLTGLQSFSLLKNFESIFLNFEINSNGKINLNFFDKNDNFFKLNIKNENEKFFFDCCYSNENKLKENKLKSRDEIFEELLCFSFDGGYFENILTFNKLMFNHKNTFILKSKKEITYNIPQKKISEFKIENEFLSISSKNKNSSHNLKSSTFKDSSTTIPSSILIKFHPKIESLNSTFIFNDFLIEASLNQNGLSGTFKNLGSFKKENKNFKKIIKIQHINFDGDFLINNLGIEIKNCKINSGNNNQSKLNLFAEYNFKEEKLNIKSVGTLSLRTINNIFENNVIDGAVEHNLDIKFFKNKLNLDGFLKLNNGKYKHTLQGINLKNIQINSKGKEQQLIITKFLINGENENKNANGFGFIEFNKNVANKFIPFLSLHLALKKLPVVNNLMVSSSATGKLFFNGFLSGISEKAIITGDLILNDFILLINTEKKTNNLYKVDCILKRTNNLKTEISGNLKKRKSVIKKFLMDVSLQLDDDAKIVGNNNLLIFLSGKINAVGETEGPHLLGKINANNQKNSSYNFAGNNAKINRGKIVYDSIEKNNPTLDVSAVTKVGSEIISCSILGRMNNIKMHFSSNMNKSEKEIISLLIFKSGLKEISNDQNRIINSFSLSMLDGNNPFGMLNKIKESIGIDSIEIFKTENLKSGELKQNFRIGKNLNKKFKIFVDSSFGEKKDNKVTARYDLMNNFGIEASIGTDKKEDRLGIQFIKDY